LLYKQVIGFVIADRCSIEWLRQSVSYGGPCRTAVTGHLYAV